MLGRNKDHPSLSIACRKAWHKVVFPANSILENNYSRSRSSGLFRPTGLQYNLSQVTPKTVYRHQNHHKSEGTVALIPNYFVVRVAEADMPAWMMVQNILQPVVDHRQSW
jgi:hypothetical protein